MYVYMSLCSVPFHVGSMFFSAACDETRDGVVKDVFALALHNKGVNS